MNSDSVRLSEEQRLDWLRLIRSNNVGPRGLRARGIEFVVLGEPDYLPRLQMIDDPPPLHTVRGKLAILWSPSSARATHRRLA